MDIWAWIEDLDESLREDGNSRLADLLERLPSAVTDNEHAVVDAIYPEALALARATGNPWIELFVRHWNLQSRILHRHEVGEWTAEAVSLLDFAHRDDTRDCPQSVCVTQDLVNAYGNVDGPGLAEARLAATGETLARIDPRWPCFVCISCERAEALQHQGDFEGMLTFLAAQTQALVEAGEEDAEEAFSEYRVEAFLGLGRAQEAQREIDTYHGDPGDDDDRVQEGITGARVAAAQGHLNQARELLPDFEEVFATASFAAEWVQAIHAIERDSGGDWQLERQLAQLQHKLERQGVRRNAIEIGFTRAELALTRGRSFTARTVAEEIERLIPDLERPLDAPERLADLRGRIRPVPTPDFADADALLAVATQDPEADLAALAFGVERWPEHEGLTVRYADALRALGRVEACTDHLAAHFARNPHHAEVVAHLLRDWVEAGRHDAVAATVEQVMASDPPAALAADCQWMLGHSLAGSDPAAARAAWTRVVELDPPAPRALEGLARLARDAGDLEAALAHLDALAALDPNNPSPVWDRAVVATLAERWDLVRACAVQLGFRIDGDAGPVRYKGGPVRIQLEGEDLAATRIGPVEARIEDFGEPGGTCHLDDVVVFEPVPLDGDDEVPLFASVAVTRPAGARLFELDGVLPKQAQLHAFEMALRGNGLVYSRQSGEHYSLFHPDHGEVRGLYAYVVVPGRIPVADAHALLVELTAGFARPLTWPALARAAGDDATADAHRSLAREWDL